jgi:hypothetical protein
MENGVNNHILTAPWLPSSRRLPALLKVGQFHVRHQLTPSTPLLDRKSKGNLARM